MKKLNLTLSLCLFLASIALGSSTQGSLQAALPSSFLTKIQTQVISGILDVLKDLKVPNVDFEQHFTYFPSIKVKLTDMALTLAYLSPEETKIQYENGKVPNIVFSGHNNKLVFTGKYNISLPLIGERTGEMNLIWDRINVVAAIGLGRKGDRIDLTFKLREFSTGLLHLHFGASILEFLLCRVVDFNLQFFNNFLKDRISTIFNQVIERANIDIPKVVPIRDETSVALSFTEDPFLADNGRVLVIGFSLAIYQNNKPVQAIKVKNVPYDYSKIDGIRILCHEELISNFVSFIPKAIPLSINFKGSMIPEFLGLDINTATLSGIIPAYRNISPPRDVNLDIKIHSSNTSVTFDHTKDTMTLRLKGSVDISSLGVFKSRDYDNTKTPTGKLTGYIALTFSTKRLHKQGFALYMEDVDVFSIVPEDPSWDVAHLKEFERVAVLIGIDFANQILALIALQTQTFKWQDHFVIKLDDMKVDFRNGYLTADSQINILPPTTNLMAEETIFGHINDLINKFAPRRPQFLKILD